MEILEENTLQQEIVLKNCFDCLVELGLERTTVRDICRTTGLKASSIYYRFSNKSEIVIEATAWGLKNIVRTMCWSAFRSTGNFEELFDGLFEEIEMSKKQLKTIYQVAGSPQYGDLLRRRAKGLDALYLNFAAELAKKFGCDSTELLPYVRLFVSVVREYALWDDKELVETNLRFVYSQVLKLRGE